MRIVEVFYLLLISLCLCFSIDSLQNVANVTEVESQRWLKYKMLCFKNKCTCEYDSVICSGVNSNSIDERILRGHPNLKSLAFTNCDEETLNFDLFNNLTVLAVNHCRVKYLSTSEKLETLTTVDLSNNFLREWNSLFTILRQMPNLVSLNLSGNHLSEFRDDITFPAKLRSLDVSHNKITHIESVPSVEKLDIAANELRTVSNIWPNSLLFLNLSANLELHTLNISNLPHLKGLNLDRTKISTLPIKNCSNLRIISFVETPIESIDLDVLKAPLLEEVDLSGCKFLCSLFGRLPHTVSSFRLSGSMVSSFPPLFFEKINNLSNINVVDNPLSKNQCLREWLNYMPPNLQKNFNYSDSYEANCSIGIDVPKPDEKKIVRVSLEERAILPCDAFGEPLPIIEWWLENPKKLIGTYQKESTNIHLYWTRNDSYRILVGGYLSLSRATKRLVERYRCVATNEHGNSSHIIYFRLDYSGWFGLKYPTAVFWGSVLAGLCCCAISFLFNLTWIACRKGVLWWIKRSGIRSEHKIKLVVLTANQRLSRVRRMVEACEKYRQKQMLSLQEGYHRRIEQIRDNYHQQVEQLRSSYASQAELFRGYRAAQKSYVNQHLESIRENYNQQMCRIREYGAKRSEQLWESYERQMTRLRAFSLQQRLRLIRQYRVKQRYVNALLERFSANSPATTLIPPAAEQAVLDPLRDLEVGSSLSRSESYYSLPEYILDEEGELHCPPRSDLPNHMLNRHHPHRLTTRISEEDVPTTSKPVNFRKIGSDANVSYEVDVKRRLSLVPSTNLTIQMIPSSKAGPA